MTDAQHEKLQAYAREVADQMRLKDWEIEVEKDEPEDDSDFACSGPAYGRKYATIRVCDDFFKAKPDEQRQTICHELIHCCLAAPTRYVDTLTDEHDLTKAQRKAFHSHLEYSIDGLADAFAPFMPLPPNFDIE